LKKEGKMKKILLATSALAMTAGFAAAEVTLSGDARMGVISPFGDGDAGFTSRARVTFTLSGETDTGLSFGASFRADNAADVSVPFDEDGDGIIEPGESTTVGGAESGRAGSVFISGAFGKLSMGDVDGAAQQAVGHVDGVGLTGLSDLNETVFLHNVVNDLTDIDPSAVYEYSTGAFTGYLSVSNPGEEVIDDEVLALGLKYTMGDYTFALGYEEIDILEHVVLGVTANFGAVSLKANAGRLSAGGTDLDQFHVSATYTMDALALTAFYSDEDDFALAGLGTSAYGLGASYDLGGGASVVGGYVQNETTDDSAFDLGLSFSF
jgi:outer membrane protein OmpU